MTTPTPSPAGAPTPLTDAACFSATTEKPVSGNYELEVCYASFPRALERALAAAKARVAELEMIVAAKNAALEVAVGDMMKAAWKAEIEAFVSGKDLRITALEAAVKVRNQALNNAACALVRQRLLWDGDPAANRTFARKAIEEGISEIDSVIGPVMPAASGEEPVDMQNLTAVPLEEVRAQYHTEPDKLAVEAATKMLHDCDGIFEYNLSHYARIFALEIHQTVVLPLRREIERLHEALNDTMEKLGEREGELIEARGDTQRLDWLEAEHRRFDPIMRLAVKAEYRREASLWANITPPIRAEIDKAWRSAGDAGTKEGAS